MIKISPSIDGLAVITTPADYTLTLHQVAFNVRAAKNISAVKTIDGGASVTVWDSNTAGERRYFSLSLKNSDFEKLKKIADFDVDEWILRAGAKTFLVVISMPAAVQNINTMMWRVDLEIIIVSEVSK